MDDDEQETEDMISAPAYPWTEETTLADNLVLAANMMAAIATHYEVLATRAIAAQNYRDQQDEMAVQAAQEIEQMTQNPEA
jgi:hypothetical protein